MEASEEYPKMTRGEGYAVGHLDDLGEGPGFRKVRKGLGRDRIRRQRDRPAAGHRDRLSLPRRAGGAVLRPPRLDRDRVRRRLGAALERGSLARVDAATVRKIRNGGEVEAVYLIAGGKDGYVGRDGRVPEGEEQRVRAVHDLSAERPR